MATSNLAAAAAAPSATAQAIVGVAKPLIQTGLIDERKALDLQAKAASDKITFLEALA